MFLILVSVRPGFHYTANTTTTTQKQSDYKVEHTGGGELPYEEYMGVCHELGSYFQEKIPKRVSQFFTKIPERAIISVRNSR